MVSSISSVPAAQPAAQSPAASQTSKPATSQPIASDTVQISNTAKVMLQETLETPAQTAKEASKGDVQALRLLAKQAAAKASVQ